MSDFKEIVAAVNAAGGRCYICGGYVRDQVLGVFDSKDMDIEVYGLSAEDVIDALAPFGNVNVVGSSFGVAKLRTFDGDEYDFSLPRRESKIGAGHRGFMVEFDPTMTPKEAARRRDFTINAMGMDPLTGEILDFYGGQEDAANKILRATSEAFDEDPLRVLRGMQFAARFGFHGATETLEQCHNLRYEFNTLSKERIFGEWYKFATKGNYVLRGFKFLLDSGWNTFFSTQNLLDTWHNIPLMAQQVQTVIDECNAVNIYNEDRAVLFFATMYSHAGSEKAEELLSNMGAYPSIIERVIPIINQMDYTIPDTQESVRRLSVKLAPASIREYLYVYTSVYSDLISDAAYVYGEAENMGILDAAMKPILQGRDLIARGMKPGVQFGQILREAFEAQLSGEIEFNPWEQFYTKNAERWLDDHVKTMLV